MVSHLQAFHKMFTKLQVIYWAVVCGKNFTSTLSPFLSNCRNVDNYEISDCMKEFYLVCEVRYENGLAKVRATLCHQILYKAWRIHCCDL